MEVTYEQVVRRTDPRQDKLKYKLATIFQWAMLAFSLVGISLLSAGLVLPGVLQTVFCGALALVSWLFKDRLRPELDYACQEKGIAIARVFNGNRRREWLDIVYTSIEAIAPVYDPRYNEYQKKAETITKASLNEPEKQYFIFGQQNGQTYLILWEPNEGLLKAVKQALPGKVRL